MNRKSISILLCFALLITSLLSPWQLMAKKVRMKLNKKKVTLIVGKSVRLKVKGTKEKVKWKSSDKKTAFVSSKGKVMAKKIGKASITAKIGKKKLICKVTVKAAEKSVDADSDSTAGDSQSSNTQTTGASASSNPPATMGTNRPSGSQPTEYADETTKPQTTEGAEVTVKPQLTAEPEETKGLQPTMKPEATEKPQPTTKSEATEKPQPTTKPEATEKPQPTTKPEATEKPQQPTMKPEATEKPQPTMKSEATEKPQPTTKPEETAEPQQTTGSAASSVPNPSTPTQKPTLAPTEVPWAPTPPVPGETPKYSPPDMTSPPVAAYDFTNPNNYRNEASNTGGAVSVVNEDGSLTITFKSQYAAFNFYLPDNAQNYYSSYKSVVLTYTSEGGDLGHALYDVNMEGVEGSQQAGKHPDWSQRVKESPNQDSTVVFNVSEASRDPEDPFVGGCIRGVQIFNPNALSEGKTITITIQSLQFCKVENPSEEDLGGPTMEPGTYRFSNDYTYGYRGGIVAYKNGSRKDDAQISVYSGENDDPFTPETEQPWDAETLLLKPGLSYTTDDGTVHPITSMLTNWNLCADPTSIDNSDVDGRLYVYGTTEGVSYADGQMQQNAYKNHSLTIMSTKDMVNWTDEGFMDNLNLTNQPADSSKKETCRWAGQQAWAPSGLKVDGDGDGKDEYYLFYTNGGVVGYVQGDSPTGPWKDDLGVPLFTKDTPNCSGVEWCFDPAVLLDDKGDAYVYFGGGIPKDKDAAHPKSGRVAKIKFEQGTGKVLLDGEPKELDTYYFFEDSEINQFHGKYFYSYCTNFSVPGRVEASGALGPIASGQIACYVSNDPMNIVFDPDAQQSTDRLKYLGAILNNPSSIYGKSYNNHHHMLTFKGHEYITYHSTALENMLYHTTKDYRCLHVDEIEVDPDTDHIDITSTYKGASQIENFNPYETINATTTSYSAGVRSSRSDVVNAMVLDKIHTGDWTKISGVDFGQKGVASVAAKIASATDQGAIEIFIDDPTSASNKAAAIKVKTTGSEVYETIQAQISKDVTGVHDVYFVFRGSGYTVATWEFAEK